MSPIYFCSLDFAPINIGKCIGIVGSFRQFHNATVIDKHKINSYFYLKYFIVQKYVYLASNSLLDSRTLFKF